jgi:hypothetical protein
VSPLIEVVKSGDVSTFILWIGGTPPDPSISAEGFALPFGADGTDGFSSSPRPKRVPMKSSAIKGNQSRQPVELLGICPTSNRPTLL